MIHAVGGPVSAKRLLKEAQWALDAFQRAQQEAPHGKKRLQAEIVQSAHLEELHTTPEEYEREVRDRLPHAQKEYVKKVEAYRKKRYEKPRSYQSPHDLVPALLIARRKAADHFGGDRVHKILAAEPLAPFKQVSHRIFEKLTGELYAEKRDRIYQAAKGLKTASERNQPVLLVLYKGHGKHKDEYDHQTERLMTEVFRQKPVSQPLKSYIVIPLPLRELAALTQLADLPNYELATKRGTNLILANSDGKPMATLRGTIQPDELAMHLWPPINESYFSRAEALGKDDKPSDALRLLRRILTSPLDQSMRNRVLRRVSQLTFDLAENWAADGRTLSALRLYRRVQVDAVDDNLKTLAGDRITELRANL
ncbi:MAG: hypothetical protein IH991_20130 [Planctomycetes bacterium]|nr:hypothetical protein [Planctomycetota bacterium]